MSNAGRKPKFNSDVIAKLEYAFSKGCSINEACLYADIDNSTFYRHVPTDSKLYSRFMELRDNPLLKARMNTVEAIEEADLDTSKWYLERKAKQEFSTKVDSDVNTDITIKLSSNRNHKE